MELSRPQCRFLVGLAALLLSFSLSAETAKINRHFILPIELDTDRGAANGDATLLRLMPGYNLPINEDWQIANIDLILLADAPGGTPGLPSNPEPEPDGDRTQGLSDWVHASFFSPISDRNLMVGAGFIASIPTATDPALGSEKWAVGPALRVTWSHGAWRVGAFGGQRWSFAGNDHREDISQLMLRATLLYDPPGRWFFVSSPIITANWNAASGDRWLVPVGGGIGRKFRPRGREWRASFQLYGNAVRPTGAPEWSARLALTAVISL